MGASAEAITMQAAPMTGEDHVLAGQLSFDEMLAGQGETRSLFNAFKTSGPGKFLTKVAVSAAGFSIGGEGIIGIASANAQGGSTAADVFDWSNVGGAPAVPGGIHSVGAAKAYLESSQGRASLSAEGLNGTEVSTVEAAVKANKLQNCTIPAGQVIPTMVSANLSVKHNVVLDDPSDPNGIPGFCVTAVRRFTQGTRKFTETIKDAIAGPCGNGLLLSKTITSVNQPKPKTAEVEVFKIALDDIGRQLVDNIGNAIDPTGEFQFQVACEDGKRAINQTVVYNQSPQPLAHCNVGSEVTVQELSTLGPEQWNMLSPGIQVQKVSTSGTEFVYKDAEQAPPAPAVPAPVPGPPGPQGPPGPPSTPPNTPPTQTPTENITETKLTTAEPVFPNSPEQLCVDAKQINVDSSGNESISVPVVGFAVASGEGTVSPPFGDQDGNPNHLCATFTSGPDFGQISEIDATAVSNDGGTEPPVVQQFTIAVQQDTF